MKQELIFNGTDTSRFFVYATRDGAVFRCDSAGASLPVMTMLDETATHSRRVLFGEDVTLEKGVYAVTLSPAVPQEKITFTLSADEESGAYPFLLTGPGVWHARFIEESLLFSAGKAEVYVAVPETDEPLTITTFRVQNPKARIFRPSGEEILPKWIPDYAAWYETDITTAGDPGYYRVCAEHTGEFRISAWNGYAMFFKKPDRPFLYAWFTPHCTGKEDYRVSIMRGTHIDVVIDRLYSETHKVPYVKGDLRLVFDAGAHYDTVEMPMPAGDDTEATVSFRRLLTLPEGWLRGDCHVHSGYEDACCTPRVITKVGRCNGLDFMFLTDHGGKNIVDNGVYTWAEEGRFSPIPGQECVNNRTHMNFLNVPFNIDYKGKSEGYWLRYAEKHNPTGNLYCPMLNHPDNALNNTAANPYFRSWWVATEHKDIPMVENISSFRTLFDLYNHNRRMYYQCTTDTHDGTRYKPGQSCAYVFTDGKRDANSIVTALRAGHFSVTTNAGAFLTYTVDGALPGGILPFDKESYHVDIELHMTGYPLKKITVIRNGFPIRHFVPEHKDVQHFTFDLTRDELMGNRYDSAWFCVIGYGDVSTHGDRDWYFEPKGITAYVQPSFLDWSHGEGEY